MIIYWWKTYWVWMMPTMKAIAIISPPPAVWLTLSGHFDKLQLKSLRTLGLLPTEVISGTMFPLADKQASKFRVGDQVCCFVSEWQRQLKPPMSRQSMKARRDAGKKSFSFCGRWPFKVLLYRPAAGWCSNNGLKVHLWTSVLRTLKVALNIWKGGWLMSAVTFWSFSKINISFKL